MRVTKRRASSGCRRDSSSLFLLFLGGVGYSEPRLEMDGGWKRGRGEKGEGKNGK